MAAEIEVFKSAIAELVLENSVLSDLSSELTNLTIDLQNLSSDQNATLTALQHTLDNIIEENDVKSILVGYPLNMDGSAGARCQSVKDFVSLMEKAWPDMPFFFFDERLSTQTVDKFLDNDHTKTRVKRKDFKDALAAKVIFDEALQWMQ